MTSMTGHGRGEAKTKTWTATVECYSVNRKSAEVVFHSERGAAWLEPFVRESVLARIARGRVQVNLLLNHTSGKSFPVQGLPKARQAIIDAGGLIPYTRRLLLEREAVKTA